MSAIIRCYPRSRDGYTDGFAFMSRSINQLSNLKVKAAKKKGLYPDGGGLYLQVASSGSKSWIFRFKLAGRARDMGLGALRDVSLADARRKAAEARRLRSDDAQRAAQRLEEARSVRFQDCAEQLIASHEAGWRNAKHRQQWRNTLATYAYPVLGKMPVADVDTDRVLRVIQPLWTSKTETASRLRGRIEAVLSWAKARELRTGENPAQWRGHLDQLLPARSKVRRVEHHPALPYRELPAFMSRLRGKDGITPLALEFVILTAARTGEALGARWDEIDLKARMWTVPAERMKAGREHRVPLSPRAIAILNELASFRVNDFVFPGTKRGKSLSDMALLMLLRDLHPGITTHGFRSTFKDWCAEQTNTPNFVSEAALAHIVADKVEAAYRRSELLEKRRTLMEAWARFCEPQRTQAPSKAAKKLQHMGPGRRRPIPIGGAIPQDTIRDTR
jgi:integrase